jgi:nuclear GTP-binding protein
MASEPTLSTLAEKAMAEDARHAFEDPSLSLSSHAKTKEQLRKYYLKSLHKVIDESDIIILVLDARDPEGCRSRIVEEEVRRREIEGKKLVFVLNKVGTYSNLTFHDATHAPVDLVPKANAQTWLKYLRHSTPTLPFLSPSASQHQRTNISSSTAPALRKLLKAYKPKAGSATVGVVGYPNVGKSSLINSLKRMKVCAVAAQPGHTRELQSVQLERGLRIIDSPGVVFDDDDDDDGKGNRKGSVLLRNVLKVEDVEDPIAVGK